MGINDMLNFRISKLKPAEKESKHADNILCSFSFETDSSSDFTCETRSEGETVSGYETIVSNPSIEPCLCAGFLQRNSDSGEDIDYEGDNIKNTDPASFHCSLFHDLDFAVDKVVETLDPTQQEIPDLDIDHGSEFIFSEEGDKHLTAQTDGREFTNSANHEANNSVIANDDKSAATNETWSVLWPSFWPTEQTEETIKSVDNPSPSPVDIDPYESSNEELIDLSKPPEMKPNKLLKLKRKLSKINCFRANEKHCEIGRLTKSESEWVKHSPKGSKDYVGILY